MARILLLSPPYLDLYGELSRAAGRYFPLGLGYIASYLRKYGGHDVAMYEPEAQGLDYEAIGRIIGEFRPDVVGLTCSTPNYTRAIALARLVKEHSGARVVMGGVHVTAIPEFIALSNRDAIDAIVIGEGEGAMLELVGAWASGSPIGGIAGIVYAEGGRAVRTPHRPYIEDLDSIPPPARDLIPQRLFIPNAHNARHRRCMTILTSRGCPYNCTFCAARLVSGTRYRMHSSEYVLDEMSMLKREYGARQLLITDDTFTLNRRRLVEICEGMIRLRLNMDWFCFSQVTAVDKDVLRLMRRAGCYNIGFGVESSEPEILKRMGKRIRPEQAVEAVHMANRAGMKTQAFYVFGTPGESLEQMQRTVRFADRVNSTLAFFNMLVPYPGTRDFEHFFGGLPLEEIDWGNFVAIGERCVLDKQGGVEPREIEHLIARANLEYYTKPSRVLRQLYHIRTPFELMNYAYGGMAFLRQILKWRR